MSTREPAGQEIAHSSVALAALTLVLIPTLAFVLSKAGVPDETNVPTSTAFTTLVNIAVLQKRERSKNKHDLINEVKHGHAQIDPRVVMLATGLIYSVVYATTALLVNWYSQIVVDDTSELLIGAFESHLPAGTTIDLGELTLAPRWKGVILLPAMVVTGIFISRSAALRLSGRKYWWLAASVFAYAGIIAVADVTMALAAGNPYNPLLVARDLLVLCLVLLVAALIGERLARRSQDDFLLTRLIQSLSEKDRLAVVDLLTDSRGRDPELC